MTLNVDYTLLKHFGTGVNVPRYDVTVTKRQTDVTIAFKFARPVSGRSWNSWSSATVKGGDFTIQSVDAVALAQLLLQMANNTAASAQGVLTIDEDAKPSHGPSA
jgi:hypothetical protein